MIANIIMDLNGVANTGATTHHHSFLQCAAKHLQYSFVETYSLKQGLKKFGDRGYAAAHKEMKQFRDRMAFTLLKIADLSPLERKKALESLIFLTEKRDGTVKARTCANGSVQRNWMSKEEAASPTASTEATLLTSVVDV